MNKITVIGDSHCQLFNDSQHHNRGVWNDNRLNNIFETIWLGPITMHRVCRDGLNVLFNSLNLNNNQQYVLSIGEIDIRCHILKQADIQNKMVDEIIDDLINNFMNKLLEFNYKDYNIHILSVIPPIQKDLAIEVNNEFPFIGTDGQRKIYTLILNQKLFELCMYLKIGYFDQHELYVDSNGYLDINKSDKIVHAIKTIELEEYIKKYFNIK